jgi:hypothetical protein
MTGSILPVRARAVRFVLGLEQERVRLGREPRLARGLGELGEPGELAGDRRGERGLVLAGAPEERGGHAALLGEEAVEDVRRLQRRIAALHRLALRLLEGFGGLFGEVAVRRGHASLMHRPFQRRSGD